MKSMSKMAVNLAVPLLALGLVANAPGQVTMTLGDDSSYAEAGFTVSLGSQSLLPSDGIIGIYSFTIGSGSIPSLSTPFWSTCISPSGVLGNGPYTYDLEPFAAAQPGLNPNTWSGANNTDGGYGIQNANYLYSELSGQILAAGVVGETGTTPRAQGAAMALAMYDALFNSTALGVTPGVSSSTASSFTAGAFSVSGAGSDVLADFENDLSYLKSGIPSSVGYVLMPDPITSDSGQDMILLADGLPQGGAVPEPTTIISGLLLLLPFGACALRIARNRKAS
jgi:hypothetical protein